MPVEESIRTIDSSTHKLVDGNLVLKQKDDNQMQREKQGPGNHLNILNNKRKQKGVMTFNLS